MFSNTTTLLISKDKAIIPAAILCCLCCSEPRHIDRIQMFNGMNIYRRAIKRYNGITFAGQKRKNAYNISRALQEIKLDRLFTHPIIPIMQLPTFGVLSIEKRSWRALVCFFKVSLVSNKLNAQLRAITIIMRT